MKKRTILCSIAAVAAVSGIIGYANRYQSPQLSDCGLANVEALTESDDIYIQFCDDICKDNDIEVCSETTATGAIINCHAMERK